MNISSQRIIAILLFCHSNFSLSHQMRLIINPNLRGISLWSSELLLEFYECVLIKVLRCFKFLWACASFYIEKSSDPPLNSLSDEAFRSPNDAFDYYTEQQQQAAL